MYFEFYIAAMCLGKMSSKIFWNTQFPTKLVFPDMTLSVFRVRPDELACPGLPPTTALPQTCLYTHQLVQLVGACTIL